MISLAPPDVPLPRHLITVPGGFAWWYLDVVDGAGNGLVLIWSFGLPFLPGYASASRAGAPQTPADRPSLNVCVYRGGRLDLYLLQELAPQHATWEVGADGSQRWCFGTSRLTATRTRHEVHLAAHLSCAVPGSAHRLEGEVHLSGALRRHDGPSAAVGEPHAWSPLVAAARAGVSLRHGRRSWHIDGRGYHDRNSADRPLHDLGIGEWLWGRAALPDRERIYYLLTPDQPHAAPRALGLDVFPDGSTRRWEDLGVARGARRWSVFGMHDRRSLRLTAQGQPWLDVQHGARVDHGPFYLRYLPRFTAPDGATARGVAEWVRPARVDLPLHRPFVRMAVHRPHTANHALIPWFSGPVEDRLARLMAHLQATTPRLTGSPAGGGAPPAGSGAARVPPGLRPGPPAAAAPPPGAAEQVAP